MVRSLIDSERSGEIKRRVYLPDVDEFRSSSGPLSEIVLDSLDAVTCHRAKPLKEGYVADLTREGGISPCSVILGLLYVHRLSETNPRYLRTMSGKDLFLTAMMIASKYLNDEGENEALTNSEWAEVGCRSKPSLDLMERQFLAAIDWRLYVSLEEYYTFVTGIEGRIALNQYARRGWLTYTDLVTIWDAMDTQRALLTATKHVAKVTCGSAAVYLVLLSTLLTASHALHSTWSPSSPLPTPTTNTTNTSTNPQLQAAVATLTKEPELTMNTAALQVYNNPPDFHPLNHRELYIKSLPQYKLHTFNQFALAGINVGISPTAHQSIPYLTTHREDCDKKDTLGNGNLQQLKRLSTCATCGRDGGTLRPLKNYCDIRVRVVDDPDFDRKLEIGTRTYMYGVSEERVFLWLGAVDLKWTARTRSVFGSVTRSDEDIDNWQYRRGESSGDSDVSDEPTNWRTFWSGLKTLGEWILRGLHTLLNFAEVLINYSSNNDTYYAIPQHKLKYAFGDPFPVLYRPSGVGRGTGRGAVPPWLVEGGHSNKPPDVLTSSRY
jgi:hypothetical protein